MDFWLPSFGCCYFFRLARSGFRLSRRLVSCRWIRGFGFDKFGCERQWNSILLSRCIFGKHSFNTRVDHSRYWTVSIRLWVKLETLNFVFLFDLFILWFSFKSINQSTSIFLFRSSITSGKVLFHKVRAPTLKSSLMLTQRFPLKQLQYSLSISIANR